MGWLQPEDTRRHELPQGASGSHDTVAGMGDGIAARCERSSSAMTGRLCLLRLGSGGTLRAADWPFLRPSALGKGWPNSQCDWSEWKKHDTDTISHGGRAAVIGRTERRLANPCVVTASSKLLG